MKSCALCGQDTLPDNVKQPAACWQCTMYFCRKPERANVLYLQVESTVKKRLLKALMLEEEEVELDERKNIHVGRSVVRKGPHRKTKLKVR